MDSISKAAQAVQQSVAKSQTKPAEPPKPSQSSDKPSAFAPFSAAVHPKAAEALSSVKQWARDAIAGQGRGLVLWASNKDGKGNGYGNGKTLLAKCAANALYATLTTQHGIPDTSGLFMTTTQFLATVRDTYDGGTTSKYFNQLKSARFLIFDDFGTEYSKELDWLREQFFKVLDYAYNARQPLMLTTNLTPLDMMERLGGKNWSRLHGMTGDTGFVNMSSIPDQRKARP